MIYKYTNVIGDKDVIRFFLLDDKLLSGSCGFFFYELISDFSLVLSNEKEIDSCSSLCVIGSSQDFFEKHNYLLKQSKNKKMFLITEGGIKSKKRNIAAIVIKDAPISIYENRQKIVLKKRKVNVVNSKFIRIMERALKSKMFNRINTDSILSRLPMSISKLEKCVSRERRTIDFSDIAFRKIDDIPNVLLYKCILSGLTVENIPLSRSDVSEIVRNDVQTFKSEVIQYIK